MNRSTIIVELFGFPGVGKTTFYNAVSHQMNYNLDNISRNDVYFFNEIGNSKYLTVLFALFSFKLFKLKVLLLFDLLKHNVKAKKIAYNLKILKYAYQLIRVNSEKKSKGKLMILDEGLLQYLLVVNVYYKRNSIIKYVRLIYEYFPNYKFIYFKRNINENLKNLKSRGDLNNHDYFINTKINFYTKIYNYIDTLEVVLGNTIKESLTLDLSKLNYERAKKMYFDFISNLTNQIL